MNNARVCIVDLNPARPLQEGLERILNYSEVDLQTARESFGAGGCPVHGGEISKLLTEFRPDLVFLVSSFVELHRLGDVVRAVMSWEWCTLPVVAVLEGDRPADMIEILSKGVADFITPPLKSVEIIPRTWRLVEQRRRGEPFVHKLKEELGLRQLIGQSPAFLAEVDTIRLIAQCDASVLIPGETGTGKELCARAVHYLSPRDGGIHNG